MARLGSALTSPLVVLAITTGLFIAIASTLTSPDGGREAGQAAVLDAPSESTAAALGAASRASEAAGGIARAGEEPAQAVTRHAAADVAPVAPITRLAGDHKQDERGGALTQISLPREPFNPLTTGSVSRPPPGPQQAPPSPPRPAAASPPVAPPGADPVSSPQVAVEVATAPDRTAQAPVAKAGEPTDGQTNVAQAGGEPANSQKAGDQKGDDNPQMTLDDFLDRLMMAESSGRDEARNPRSSATGAFQFINATFLDVARRHFAEETETLTPAAILALRTDRDFARRAAKAYTNDNAVVLAEAGHKPTFTNLRLAFLLGPYGAIRVLDAAPKTPIARVLPPAVLSANPFMAGMTAADLVAKAARDLEVAAQSTDGIVGVRVKRRKPSIKVACDLNRASCQRWLALARKRAAEKARQREASR